MARDIQIPFGPDKTNGAGFDPIAPEGEAGRDPFAEPPVEAYARTGSSSRPVVIDAFAQAPASSADAQAAPSDAPVVPAMEAASHDQYDELEPRGALSEEEATAQGMDEMQMSILALKDSIGQGRELRAREKEFDELAEALEADYEELADRENILSNFAQVAGEQDAIIDDRTQQRDARKAQLAQVSAQLDATNEELARMRDYHAAQMQPLETELGQARAYADQAKNDERSRKSELSAAESELRRANDSDPNTTAIAQHNQVQAAYDEAHRRSDQAKERLAQVQRVFDDARAQIEQAEGPLERSIEELSKQTDTLKEEISQLGEEISAARKRRQYCEIVYQHPEETDRMRAEVAAAEQTARQMDAENERLREQLADSKQKARKAKVAIGIVIAIVIVFFIVLFIVSAR